MIQNSNKVDFITVHDQRSYNYKLIPDGLPGRGGVDSFCTKKYRQILLLYFNANITIFALPS